MPLPPHTLVTAPKTPKAPFQAFCEDLDTLIDHYCADPHTKLTYATIIGTLQVKSHLLCRELETNEHMEAIGQSKDGLN